MVGAADIIPFSGFLPILSETPVHPPLAFRCLENDRMDGVDVSCLEDVFPGSSRSVHDDFQGIPDDSVIVVGKIDAEVPGPLRNAGAGRGEVSVPDIGIDDPGDEQDEHAGYDPDGYSFFPGFPFPSAGRSLSF